MCIKGFLYLCILRIKYFIYDKFLFWIFLVFMNFGGRCSLKKKMFFRFLIKFEKYDLWSVEIFFLKFVIFKIINFFFILFLYCYCKIVIIWCRIWCLKSIDRRMIIVCSMWFLKFIIGCLKFKYICKSVFVYR